MTSTLSSDDFPAFFTEVTGHAPFAWQIRLVERLLRDGRWPDAIGAPTGSGKSAVIEAHAFAVAAAGASRNRPPRRLAIVVDRRALVDSHATRSQALAEHLQNAVNGSVSSRVREALSNLALTVPPDPSRGGKPALRTVVLRGAAPHDRSWVDDVLSCTVICATPEMFGSRLLFRGYGSSRGARPREAGLLAYDCAAVIDEAHLSRQLECTARRIPVLEQISRRAPGVPPLQVVSTSATLADQTADGAVELVTPDDLSDHVLEQRLRAPKPIRLVPTATWPGPRKPKPAYIETICERVVSLRAEFSHEADARTVGCIVNNVDTAQRVARRLAKHTELTVVCRTGRTRPFDFDRGLGASEEGAVRSYPGLYSIEGNPDVDVLVTTQTIEVGVNIDLSALVTELAPGSALAQRFGRVNRIGRSPISVVEVILPSDTSGSFARLPYSTPDLVAAMSWLEALAHDAEGASPWAIAQLPPPAAELRRTLLQRPEDWNARHWSHTSLPGFADDDLSLFLQDDLESQQAEVGVVVRSRLPEDDTEALALLRAVPPQAVEVFPCALWIAQGILDTIMSLPQTGSDERRARAYRFRDNEVDQLNSAAGITLSAGDVLVVDEDQPILDDAVVSPHPRERAAAVPWHALDGVVALLTDDEVEALGPEWELDAVTEQAYARFSGLLPDIEEDDGLDVIFETNGDEQPHWVVVLRRTQAHADEMVRQEVTATGGAVPLSQHEKAVAVRAEALASALGVDPHLTTVLSQAAALHDHGKQAVRFQRMLGARQSDPLLAKSRQRSTVSARRAKELSGLPTRWRHEQLSAAYAWNTAIEDDANRSLTVQLVGTSHGHGRPFFLHSAATLLAGTAPLTTDSAECEVTAEPQSDEAAERENSTLSVVARQLFDEGEWETLVEQNRQNYGTWGVAFLEAVLRAADAQISKEAS